MVVVLVSLTADVFCMRATVKAVDCVGWQSPLRPFLSMPPLQHDISTSARDITERTRAPSGVAAFMSAHSKTPYITPSMDCYSGKGVVQGRRGQNLGFAL